MLRVIYYPIKFLVVFSCYFIISMSYLLLFNSNTLRATYRYHNTIYLRGTDSIVKNKTLIHWLIDFKGLYRLYPMNTHYTDDSFEC